MNGASALVNRGCFMSCLQPGHEMNPNVILAPTHLQTATSQTDRVDTRRQKRGFHTLFGYLLFATGFVKNVTARQADAGRSVEDVAAANHAEIVLGAGGGVGGALVFEAAHTRAVVSDKAIRESNWIDFIKQNKVLGKKAGNCARCGCGPDIFADGPAAHMAARKRRGAALRRVP